MFYDAKTSRMEVYSNSDAHWLFAIKICAVKNKQKYLETGIPSKDFIMWIGWPFSRRV